MWVHVRMGTNKNHLCIYTLFHPYTHKQLVHSICISILNFFLILVVVFLSQPPSFSLSLQFLLLCFYQVDGGGNFNWNLGIVMVMICLLACFLSWSSNVDTAVDCSIESALNLLSAVLFLLLVILVAIILVRLVTTGILTNHLFALYFTA